MWITHLYRDTVSVILNVRQSKRIIAGGCSDALLIGLPHTVRVPRTDASGVGELFIEML